jgi:hypothetical protein
MKPAAGGFLSRASAVVAVPPKRRIQTLRQQFKRGKRNSILAFAQWATRVNEKSGPVGELPLLAESGHCRCLNAQASA